jgi:hypothetical protein
MCLPIKRASAKELSRDIYCHYLGNRIGLDYWVYCTLHIHTLGLQGIQRYCRFTHFTVHRYKRTRVHSLH